MKYLPIIFLLLCGCEPRLAQHFKEPKILTDSKGTNYVVEHCGGHECSVRVITP